MLGAQADGWRNVDWFDESLHRVATGHRGELWFVAGNAAGVLRQVRQRAADFSTCLVAGPTMSPAAERIHSSLVGLIGTSLALLRPVAELVFLLGYTGVQVMQDRIPPDNDPVDLYGLLDDLLREARATGMTVVLIIEAVRRDEDRWNTIFAQVTARRGQMKSQNLIVLFGLPDGPIQVDKVNETFPSMVRAAASLVAENRARWHGVPPLTEDDVRSTLPVTIDAARHLITVTAGDDLLATKTWNRWVSDKVVRRESGHWELTDRGTDWVPVGLGWTLGRLVGDDRVRIDRLEDALTCAAINGLEFSCEAIA